MVSASEVALPFAREEHLERQSRLRSELRRQGWDAMLVFADRLDPRLGGPPVPLPLHPGAIRYYEEAGLAIPARLKADM